MNIKRKVKSMELNNLMTFATDQKYCFFSDTVIYKGIHCLFSVATIKEEIPHLHLQKDQVVVMSPVIGPQGNNNDYIIYNTFDIDIESGLFIPIISWALEFTKQILSLNEPVYIENSYRIIEMILLQVWRYEEIKQSDKGLNIDLLNPVSWESIIGGKVQWENFDSLAEAEILLKNGMIDIEDILLPHVHEENIEFFRRAGLSDEVIIDW